ncbi:hypothetical protein AYI70_g6928 [Smittium culicis]|uniref:Uncharacterized protein n=1 Tax=Smittium culicis TaxID=133412 RepID=A0A1R1XMT6_9FUNG|nr:hypothetical protein AYI70_g6928 [Smittium culicis]
MYQTEKIEEDITVVNIPNLGDVDILTLLNLIKDTLEPISGIIDISALRRKGLTEFLPYGVKILLRKKSVDTIIPSFLDYEYGKINIFYRGCKEACSYCKQEGHWKSNYQTYDQIKGTAEADIGPDVQSGADEPRYVDHTPVSEDSYGYSTPTELEIMAEKARNNIITEAQYIEYEKKYFAENFSETAAEINYSSDPPDHTDQDMDFE